MGTFSALVTDLAGELRDPSNKTWTTTDLGRAVNEAVIEVGRIAPSRFTQDLIPVANQLSYDLDFPETELMKVEQWDTTQSPESLVQLVQPASQEYVRDSTVGWFVWGGTLYIPPALAALLDPARHVLRIWGYQPYAIVSGSTELPMSDQLEYAVRARAKVQCLEMLVAQRNLFTQWQAQPGNTDISAAVMMQQLTMARADWERYQAKLIVLRENH